MKIELLKEKKSKKFTKIFSSLLFKICCIFIRNIFNFVAFLMILTDFNTFFSGLSWPVSDHYKKNLHILKKRYTFAA
jgi:hypothetical protein